MLFDYISNTFKELEPRTFASLMELYEDNYLKLRRLVPDIEAVEVGAVSRVTGAVPLFLQMIEKQKYTSTLILTHIFEQDGEQHDDPCLTVRICYDARTVEAMIDENSKKFGFKILCSQRSDFPLESRWELNKFLNKWLKYCLREGHSFNVGIKKSA